jgi:Fe-S cluster biogenesis protein NfuA
MPEIVEIEDTPNPNAKKFILKEPLTIGITCSFENAEQAKSDALAEALFDIEHITNVFYIDKWITVTQDGGANWQELVRKLAAPIRTAPTANDQTEVNTPVADSTMTSLSQDEQQRLDSINQLIDDQVRPALQGDGGDLNVVGLNGNLLSVHYQGACGSCPSSIAGTLRGIENLVRSIEPDIDVVAV